MKRILILLMVLVGFEASAQKKLTLDNFFKTYDVYANYVYGFKSMNDGEHYTAMDYSNGQKLVKYSYKTGKPVATLVDFTQLGLRAGNDYVFSNDETKILFYTNRKRIYRRSFTADYYVYDLKTKELIALNKDHQQRIAAFSPDGNKVAYMYQNNLYVFDLKTRQTKQITFDGEMNKIINGAPDWVYEEEFEFNKAYQWSPDGKYIAYVKFDESNVRSYMLKFYDVQEYEPYPEIYKYKYPKAGEDNSIVTVHVYNLETGKTVKADIGEETDIYIPRIKWRPDGKYLAIERENRAQNKIDLLYANPDDGSTKVVLTETNKYYIETDFLDNLRFLPGNKLLVLSERSGWRHFYLYDWSGNFLNPVTKGKWDVLEYVDYNPKTQTLYYKAAKVKPIQNEIYAISLDGKKDRKITDREGSNDIEFSKNFKYYMLSYSSANTPPYFALYNSKGKLVRVLEDNKDYAEYIKQFGDFKKEFFTFTTSEGVTLWAYKILPPNFDPKKKYPVIVTQYSGPNSQTVTDSWSYSWNNYWASLGYIVIGVDTRGTGARGEAFRKITFHQLGNYESRDLMETAKYLATLPYVDKDRLAIWGWSYGGFMVLSVMTRYPGYYSVGITTAPVTNWRFYDNIYTERYMGKPQDNPDGYDKNSPLTYAKDLEGHLLIIHGGSDDNVHPQNTYEFIKRLEEADKDFEMFIYPNRNHSIYGPNIRLHLFRQKTKFLNKYLHPENE